MVDPYVLSSASASFRFVDVIYELQVMCSDRVDPSDPVEDEEHKEETTEEKPNEP